MPRKNVDSPAANGARAALAQPDRFVHETYATARAQVEHSLDEAAAYTQRNPEKALLSAVATGYVLRLLPTTRIIGAIVRLAMALIKPAVLIYGVAKLRQMTQGRKASPGSGKS